jgi:hypothetical protein
MVGVDQKVAGWMSWDSACCVAEDHAALTRKRCPSLVCRLAQRELRLKYILVMNMEPLFLV